MGNDSCRKSIEVTVCKEKILDSDFAIVYDSKGDKNE